jgi:hypothetical protein
VECGIPFSFVSPFWQMKNSKLSGPPPHGNGGEGGARDGAVLESENGNEEKSPSQPNLPYDGCLQEAIKQQDREAVKYLMLLRQSQQQGISNDSMNETKKDSSADVTLLHECLLSLGFSPIQLYEYFHSPSLSENEDEVMTNSEALKSILDSERHFPNPALKNSFMTKSKTNSSHHNFPKEIPSLSEEQQVNPQMLRGLDPESTWTLLQCCVNHPTVSQLQIYEILAQLNSLSAVYLINQSACKWLRDVVIKGYIPEVKCILRHLYLLLQSDSSSPSPPTDQTCSDQLLMSYMCPITREILVEPVTLQVSPDSSVLVDLPCLRSVVTISQEQLWNNR